MTVPYSLSFAECNLPFGNADDDAVAFGKFPGQNIPGQGIQNQLLQRPFERPRAVNRAIALFGYIFFRRVCQFKRELTLGQPLVDQPELDADNPVNVVQRQTVEHDDVVDAV